MDAYNLAVVIGPNLLPTEEKSAPNTVRVTKTCELFKLLIENAIEIGVLPESVIEKIAVGSSQLSLHREDSFKRKRKGRSGSLTSMLFPNREYPYSLFQLYT